MALIFISHSSKDNEKIKPIIEKIKENNFDSIFLDFDEQDGIHVGEKWEKRIYSEIQRSHVILVLFSPAWIESKWCFAEYRLAKSLGKEIIPLIIENGEDNEIDKWIENHIQKSDFSKDKEVLSHVISRIREISMETQKGFKWDRNRLPYPGLLSFEEEDAPIFFGRERDSKIIIERLNAMQNNSSSKLLNIVSASGLGKSSLLKAGVIPKLKLSYNERWKVLEVLRPTLRPLYEFTKLIAKTLGEQANYKKLYEELKGENYRDSLDDIMTELEFLSVKKKSILLPIDQVEEFYSLSDIEEKRLFFRVLDYLLDKKDIFFTIWTLRSDFLKEFQIDSLSHILHRYEEVYSLSVISNEDIDSIIKEPAYVAGVNIEEKLLSKIKEDMQTVDALPILALCLNELYGRYAKNGNLTLVDYQHLGESETSNPMENIIRRKADDAIVKYKDNPQKLMALKDAFIPNLVRINAQDRYVQKDALLSDLPKNSHEILETLVKARLLVKRNINGEVRIEVSHEALIRKWSLLQQWLKDEHDFLISKSRLEIALNEWNKSNKDSKALLGGLQLEKASLWKEKLIKEEEITFVNESLHHQKSKKRKREQLYIFSFVFIFLFALTSLYNWKKADGYLFEIHATLEESTIKKALVYRDHLNEPLKAKLLFAKMLDENKVEDRQRLSILYNSINKNLTLIDIQEHQDKYNGVEASKKYKGQILVWTLDHKVELWDMSTRTKLCSFKHEDNIKGARFIENENFILSWSDDGKVKIFDRVNKVIQRVYSHSNKVKGAIFNKETNKLLTWAGDSACIWDRDNEQGVLKTLKHEYDVEGAMFSINSEKIITWSNKHIKVWNTVNKTSVELFHDDLVKGVLLNKNETKLLSWGEDNTLRLWNLKNGTELRHFRHKGMVNGARFSQNEEQVLSWSEDSTIRLWSIPRNKELNFYKHKGSVDGAMFYTNETEILAWGGEESTQSGEVKLWNVQTAEKLFSIVHNSAVYMATLNKEKNMIESWSSNWNSKIAEIRKWQIKKGKSIKGKKFQTIDSANSQLVFKNSKELKVYDKKGNNLQVFKHYLNINGARFNKKRDKVLTWSDDSTVKLWSIEEGKELLLLKHSQVIKGAMLNKDETLILSWTRDNVRLWDMHENMLLSLVKKDLIAVKFDEGQTRILMLDKKKKTSSYELYPKSELKKDNYLLEIAVENGIILTEAGEITVLSAKQWKEKKEEYRRLK